MYMVLPPHLLADIQSDPPYSKPEWHVTAHASIHANVAHPMVSLAILDRTRSNRKKQKRKCAWVMCEQGCQGHKYGPQSSACGPNFGLTDGRIRAIWLRRIEMS